MLKQLVVSLPFILYVVAACADPCALQTPQDVLACALQNHPDIQRARARAAQREALRKAAAQRPNPEVNAESAFSNVRDRMQAAYLHTFEPGGRRRRRLEEARAEGEALAVALQKTQEDVALQTAVKLYRLSHIQAELKAFEETLATFKKIIEQYRARPRLTPEQEMSLNVFFLARSDLELRKASLLQEQQELQAYFDLATGANFQTILSALPPRKSVWPELASPGISAASAERREAQSALDLSKARLGLARGEAWPGVKAGPLAEMESGESRLQGYGAALSLSLPIYQRNQGRRAVAAAEVKQAETHLTLREQELKAELEQWRHVYDLAVESLAKTPSISQMEEAHKAGESLFERGLVSGPMVIEAHRQMVEFTASQNKQELRAIEALWSIYALEGRILREKL